MTPTIRKKIVNSLVGLATTGAVFVVLLLHNAWGDDRYQLKEEAIRTEISRLDTQLTIIDQEILFAETERQKQKFESMKAIFEREKEALREKLSKEQS